MTIRFAAILLFGAVSGCTTMGAGTPSGAEVGFAGQPPRPADRPAAQAIVAAMAGGLVAGDVGAGLSQAERLRAVETEYRALEYARVGDSMSWGEKPSGRWGEVTPASPYRVGSQDCRQYTHTVHLDGQSRSARGTACRNPDGSWTPLI
jgi:surface antigen